jgi:hypothetical protein
MRVLNILVSFGHHFKGYFIIDGLVVSFKIQYMQCSGLAV